MVYHSIVARIARENFERVNARDHKALLSGCTDNIKHRFGGSHALGGERNDKESLRRWFKRLALVCDDLVLNVREVWVKGWPWDTTVFIRWTSTATFPDGSPYENHGVHVVRMRWGKAYEIDANEDSQAVAELLEAKAEAGMAEASAPQITS